MEHTTNGSDTRAGTIGGTLLVILINIQAEQVWNTIIQAAVAALVSFSCSMLLRYLLGRFRQK